jgi:hypothetical protein
MVNLFLALALVAFGLASARVTEITGKLLGDAAGHDWAPWISLTVSRDRSLRD